MRVAACLLALCTLIALAPQTPLAKSPARPAAPYLLEAPSGHGAAPSTPPARPLTARTDTLWFGGDDGTGHALFSPELADPEAAMWTWDADSADPFEGWITRDMTEDDGDYFGRVTVASFAGDPCAPIFTGETGQIWCGMHQADADERDWFGGMGYGNWFCQGAFSPFLPCDGQRALSISFKYFQDSEADFDYTYLCVHAYDGSTPPEELTQIQAGRYTGAVGSPSSPATSTKAVAAYQLPAATQWIRVEFRFDADGGWSDEDGLYLSDCGPFAADEISVAIGGGGTYTYDFEMDDEGWSFARCPGVGAFMTVWPEEVWGEWVETLGLPCGCTGLAGDALGCVDVSTPFPLPGHPQGQNEMMQSGICEIDREQYPVDQYNLTLGELQTYTYGVVGTGSFCRMGVRYYPYTSLANPYPHWSPRMGDATWFGIYGTPCAKIGPFNMVYLSLPANWEKMRFVFEFITDCAAFGIDPPNCRIEGQTNGAPLIDDVRIGLLGAEDVPTAFVGGGGQLFTDGYGQNFPLDVEPGDVGNANVSFDLNMMSGTENDIHADTASVEGPAPTGRSWLCDMVLRVERKGPRQDLIAGYAFWKNRLQSDPEAGWVSVLMDSSQGPASQVSDHVFVTYFHEDDPGFRGPRAQDYNELNEILPDLVFTPGTRIRYYYAPYWVDAPEQKGYCGPYDGSGWEFEILPCMEAVPGSDWDVVWPSVLYVSPFAVGESIISPTLAQLGLAYDTYHAMDRGGNYCASIQRSFRNGTWGNNGMTTQQMHAYRLVLFGTDDYSASAFPAEDFQILEEWLEATDCPEATTGRRGLVLNGCHVGAIMDDPQEGVAAEFLNSDLGAQFVGYYIEMTGNLDDCLRLVPASGALFLPAADVCLYGSGCPSLNSPDVIDTHPVSGTPSVGNLAYLRYDGQGTPLEFSQIARDLSGQPGTNWKSLVDAVSFHHLTACGTEQPCFIDSATVAAAAANVLGPALQWITDVNDPFVPWRYGCQGTGDVEESEGHLAGAVNFLYPCRPNPCRPSAAIRFHLARAGRVELVIYDVTGRRVRALLDGERAAGEQSIVWDGTDDAGCRLAGGIYWVQMRAGDYASARRIVQLR